ncbi:MAG: ankyrin repeat domain-containing protein [Alphaproteobacteria bacterium]
MYTDGFQLDDDPFKASSASIATGQGNFADIFGKVRAALAARRRVIVLLGAPGLGKSALLRLLAGQLAADGTATVLRHANRWREADDLIDEARRDEAAVLLVDDAADFGAEALGRLLARPAASERRMVLAGQPGFADRLRRACPAEMAEDDIVVLTLEPLPPADVGAFIDEKLAMAGGRRNEIFEASAVNAIAAVSEGIPRQINRLCSTALFLASLTDNERIDAAIVAEAAAGMELAKGSTAALAATEPPETAAPTSHLPVPAPMPLARPQRLGGIDLRMAAGACLALAAAIGIGAFATYVAPERTKPADVAFIAALAPAAGGPQPAAEPTPVQSPQLAGDTAAREPDPVAATSPFERRAMVQPVVLAGDTGIREPDPRAAAAVFARRAAPAPLVLAGDVAAREPDPVVAARPHHRRAVGWSFAERPPSRPAPLRLAGDSEAMEPDAIGAARPFRRQARTLAFADVARPAANETDVIAALLARGAAQVKALKLTTPATDNALDTYLHLLSRAPHHPGALAGIETIAKTYVSLAWSAQDRGKWRQAGRYAERARELAPTDPGVRKLLAWRAARGEPGARPVPRRPVVADGPAMLPRSLIRDPTALRRALADGASTRGHYADGHTPLTLAAQSRRHASIELLLDAGADPNRAATTSGWTALTYAAWQGDAGLVQRLLEAGAQPDLPTDDGQSPFLVAAINGHRVAASRLLAAGADPNRRTVNEWTALMYAVWDGRVDMVDLILREGGDPRLVNQQGLTAADLAQERNGDASISLLLARDGRAAGAQGR